jgi:predicted Zn-dependent protease
VGLVLFLGLVLAVGGVLGWRLWLAHQRQRALDQAREGDFEAAAPALHRALERSPDDVPILEELVRGHLKTDDKVAALPLLDRWCRLRPEDAEPFRLRMQALRQTKPAGALADGLHLLQRNPQDVGLRLRVAGLHFATGDFALAEKECRDVLRREPGRTAATRLLAETLKARGQRDEAARLLDNLLRKHPGDTAAMLGRAVLHLDTGQPQRAIPLLEQVLQLDPRRQRTGRYQLALAYERAGRPADARRVLGELQAMQEAEVLNDALRSQPNNPDVQLRAARALLAGRHVGAALDLIGKVLERRPADPEAHRLLATYYDSIGQTERAAEHRRRAGDSR